MAGPSPKRIKSGLPLCTIHRPGNRLVKQNFPVALEEALCGVTSALLEVSYVFQLLGENFDLSDMSLPNVAKFFWEQAKEERKEAETLIQYQHDRGGLYCTKLIQKPANVYIKDVIAALEVALVQWKMLAGYFEDLYSLSVKASDPHTASTIKKRFLAPKIQKIKLMGDLITNARRLRSTQDSRGDLENYLIDRLQKELRVEADSEAHCSPCTQLEKCAGIAKGMQLLPEEFRQHNNNIKLKYSRLHCCPSQPWWKGLREADQRREHKWH